MLGIGDFYEKNKCKNTSNFYQMDTGILNHLFILFEPTFEIPILYYCKFLLYI